jgi:hypothetical protein
MRVLSRKLVNLEKTSINWGQRRQLEALGFAFKSFDERLEECRAFRKSHGHLIIPQQPQDEAGKDNHSEEELSLQLWAETIRVQSGKLEAGENSRINWGQRRQLEALGFCWQLELGRGTPVDKTKDQDLPKISN